MDNVEHVLNNYKKYTNVVLNKTKDRFRTILSSRITYPKMLILAWVLVVVMAGSQTLAHDSEDFFNYTNNHNDVVIWSKSTCPYCIIAKDIFKRLNQHYTAVEIDKRADKEELIKVLEKHTGCKYVPKVYIKGKYIGGTKTIKIMKDNGLLQELLNPSVAF